MTKRDWARNGAQLAGLWALAVAQPLFEVLKTGEAFVMAGWHGGEIVLFALGAVIVPPAVLLGLEALAGRLAPRLTAPLHLAFVAGQAAIFVAYVLKRATDIESDVTTPLILVAFALAAVAFHRFEPVRSFATVLGPAPVLVVLLFLFGSPVRQILFPADGADLAGPRPSAPVVMIVFDEFPTLSLLDRRGELDRRTFPAFASLADDGTWFRHATTVADFTTSAIPAMLTGRHFDGTKPPSSASQPDNLLALLGQRGGADAREDLTRMCPEDVCEPTTPKGRLDRFTRPLPAFGKIAVGTWLPDGILRRLPETNPYPLANVEQGFGRLATAPNSPTPAIRYLHVNLPHGPWFRLPSGKAYRRTNANLLDFVPGAQLGLKAGFPSADPVFRWTSDPERVTVMRQRHLAQVRYADTLLGLTLAQLRKSGLYDRALVVVTADHGISFAPGGEGRQLSEENAPAVMFVPLFVKAPGERRGRTSARFVQSTDLAPGVASLLGLKLPWKTDGRAAYGPSGPDRTELVAHAVQTGRRLEFDAAGMASRLRAEAAAQGALFGGGDSERIFRTGPHRALVGRRVDELPRGPAVALRHELADQETEFDLDLRGFLPSLLSGRLEGPGADRAEVLLAVNGRLAAAPVVYRSSGETRYQAFVSERDFRHGRNELALYAVSPGPDGPRLAEVPAAGP